MLYVFLPSVENCKEYSATLILFFNQEKMVNECSQKYRIQLDELWADHTSNMNC